MIGEGGVRLSGGQAQRLSIARALLLNPSILLMDDGASALDARTEVKIQKAISEILRTRTTVITTHRLAIIAKADLVIIMEDGKIVGLGSHEQLIRKKEVKKDLDGIILQKENTINREKQRMAKEKENRREH